MDLFFDIIDTEDLLVGERQISVSLHNEGEAEQALNPVNQTKLKYGCFLQYNQGWHVCNQNISAILITHIYNNKACLIGILNPDPKHRFSPELLPSIPFVRLKKWPPEHNILEVEWIKYEKNIIVDTIQERKSFWYDSGLN